MDWSQPNLWFSLDFSAILGGEGRTGYCHTFTHLLCWDTLHTEPGLFPLFCHNSTTTTTTIPFTYYTHPAPLGPYTWQSSN